MMSLIPRMWVLGLAVLAFTSWTGFVAYKVHSATTRNLTALHARKMQQLRSAITEERYRFNDMLEHAKKFDPKPVFDSDIKRVCAKDPNCKGSDRQK